ncbi:HalOD1 output domain-containing protein [Haloarchaeobius amylolyticus]|uniref:HalOD1 output domain-containing protein n=1 Tax=Haloarchaeobius amylolyticus TaxID=1198296 RepID=UPI002271DED3|nr:HalOD1 output domain-containing protein [Haloarchaeobius amylolyticus]
MRATIAAPTPDVYDEAAPVTARVVAEVARVRGVAPDELPALDDAIDPMVLSVLRDTLGTDESLDSTVAFPYADCCVTVEPCGSVTVEALDSD